MLLYVCSHCGAWSDVTLADVWAKTWQSAGKAFAKGLAETYGLQVEELATEEPTGWPCPVNAEHGYMRAVTSEDRLIIRSAGREAEQGEDDSERRQRLLTEIEEVAGRRLGLVGMNDLTKASTTRLQEFLATMKENARYL